MPADFVAAPASWPLSKRADEQETARAYWECAQSVIQWKYGLRQELPLPVDPPPEFTVARGDLSEQTDPSTRLRYWERLREIWYLPSTWKRGYEWSFEWMSSPVTNGAKWLQDNLLKLLNYTDR